MFTRLNGNKYSETFYTNKDGHIVCIDCLGYKPKTLQDLNEERKKLKERSK
jgi:DNA polymerase elongation subunit (family B)